MIYLGDQAVGIINRFTINWDKIALGEEVVASNIVLSDSVNEIKDGVFSGLGMTSFTGKNVKTVGANSFYACTKLRSLDLPNATQYKAGSLYGCSKLVDISFMETEILNSRSLWGTGISYIVAPNLKQIDSDAIYSITSLMCLDIGNEAIDDFVGNGYVFDQSANCVSIFRYGYVLPALNSWFYSGCWMCNKTIPGTLYVWEDLIDDYQNHAIWGPLLASNNNQILPIEGSMYEHQYGDGTPIE